MALKAKTSGFRSEAAAAGAIRMAHTMSPEKAAEQKSVVCSPNVFLRWVLTIMLLSRDAILRHFKNGNIVIDPFDDRKMKTTSYDVGLGEWFWREAHPESRSTLHNPYDEDSTKRVWQG